MPTLSVADASLREGSVDGTMRFAVMLTAAATTMLTAEFHTTDGTTNAGEDYVAVSGTLTIDTGAASHTIAVPILDDDSVEDAEMFTVSLTNPQAALLARGTAIGTISDDDAPEPSLPTKPRNVLQSLQVTGAASALYPAFAAHTYHYALTCEDSSTLQVTAQADSTATSLTLLRDNTVDNHVSVGTLNVQVHVQEDHDIAIRLRNATGLRTYFVHCLPRSFPVVAVKKKKPHVSGGLLFLTIRYGSQFGGVSYLAIIDNKGVPRFHRRIYALDAVKFQRHVDKPFGISFSYIRELANHNAEVVLLDDQFDELRTVQVTDPMTDTDIHDFAITKNGFLLTSYDPTTRDFSSFGGVMEQMVKDSVIQEVSPSGEQEYIWNSYDHLKLSDCRFKQLPDYAHLNSLELLEDDIVASFRGCSQVLRIARSKKSDTDPGTAVVWQVGGTRNPNTKYLDIVGDPAEEICGQHSAKITDAGNLVLFDNGTGCLGPRKELAPFSR